MTPMKAIRAKCLDCCCGQIKEVRLCPCSNCPLYPYRFGKNPNIKLTDEQRAERAARLEKTSRQQGEKFHSPADPSTDTPQPSEDEKPLYLIEWTDGEGNLNQRTFDNREDAEVEAAALEQQFDFVAIVTEVEV